METKNLFSAVKRWQQKLSLLCASVRNRLAQARREKHRREISEEAQRRQDLLALQDRLRQRLHARLKEKLTGQTRRRNHA